MRGTRAAVGGRGQVQRLAAVKRDPWQVAIFQLSGGTTGVPKIIPRFHNEYLYTIRAMIRFSDIDETLVAFTPSPLMHNAPMISPPSCRMPSCGFWKSHERWRPDRASFCSTSLPPA